MQVIGDRLRKIEASRSEKLEQPLQIKTNINLEAVEKKELFAAGEKKDGLIFDYLFNVTFGKTSGYIKVKGSIFAIGDKKATDDVEKEWTKKKKLKKEIMVPVLNKALELALLTAVPVSKELGLPIPIQLPRFVAEDKKKGTTDTKQTNVG